MRTGFGCIFSSNYAKKGRGLTSANRVWGYNFGLPMQELIKRTIELRTRLLIIPTPALHRKPDVKFCFELIVPRD